MNNMQNFKTIAVDFDGTLCFSSWPELGEPNTPLIEYLKKWKSEGNKLTSFFHYILLPTKNTLFLLFHCTPAD